MPAELLALLEVPAIRELVLDFVVWLLAQSSQNPQFAPQYSAFISQLRNPNLTTEERQHVLSQLDALRATS